MANLNAKLETVATELDKIGFDRDFILIDEEGDDNTPVGFIFRHRVNVRAEVRVDATTVDRVLNNLPMLRAAFA